MCRSKGNEPIEPIVRDILVPVQGDHAVCVEIANWKFLYVLKIAGIKAIPRPAPTNARARSS